jgi:hypothetical protein
MLLHEAHLDQGAAIRLIGRTCAEMVATVRVVVAVKDFSPSTGALSVLIAAESMLNDF